MKNSYKLLIGAAIILFGTTTAYDFALKAEYEKGIYKKPGYKDPMQDFTKLGYKNFNIIEINAADLLNIEISHSDTFDVRVKNDFKDEIKIKQEGSRIIISFDKKKAYVSNGRSLVIRCPVIDSLITDAVLMINGKRVVTLQGRYNVDFGHEGVKLQGFQQDSLTLTINNASIVSLKNNKLDYLKADLGISESSYSRPNLSLDKSNEINYADLNLQNKSRLSLNNISIKHLEFKISDSAQVQLSGASLKLIKR